eukprot:CAMPEP_0203672346 /NCGR_PEP_ID=MMETSP0090-20130426/8238_1 /ASSEMBLY_ACC=CAM_ASM_001088 /TAXON_ID=426623 /ORGANISM="Chaetoceros affinis, Strain CCMP159" /LENGTH=134 /DNA_ID=CAMNT_0050537651 /DNA_START=93 /DNA_END=497 /DNA_ORIENTATION=+
MQSLTKEQKDELATSFAVLALYDGGASITPEQIITLLEATGNEDVEAYYPIIFAQYLSKPGKIAELICNPGGTGNGRVGVQGGNNKTPSESVSGDTHDKDNTDHVDKEVPLDLDDLNGGDITGLFDPNGNDGDY